jgi:hypothetical protein
MAEIVETSATVVDELNALSRDELVERFLGLEPPTAEEFVGELDGHAAAYLPLPEVDAFYRSHGLGTWLGKGYRIERHGDWLGHGYNLWDTDTGVIRTMRFGWGLGTSMLDGRGCLLMHYGAFDNAFGELDLVDEIRRAAEGVFLGLATTREPSPLAPRPGGPNGRSLESTFLLVGPVRDWVGPDDPSSEVA